VNEKSENTIRREKQHHLIEGVIGTFAVKKEMLLRKGIQFREQDPPISSSSITVRKTPERTTGKIWEFS
jgi:hypothetical protein